MSLEWFKNLMGVSSKSLHEENADENAAIRGQPQEISVGNDPLSY